MKKTILFFALLFFAVAGFAQVRPDQQTTKTPADTDAIYTQEDGSLKKVLFGTFKQYVIDGTLDSLILIQDSILIAFNGAGTEIFRDTIAVGSINTDNQTIDTLQLNGTTLELSLEGDGQALQTVNLSSLQDGTGTDNQTIDTLQLNGTTLEISLEGDGQALQTVNLSSLQDGTGTDDQTAAEVPNTPAGNISATDMQAVVNELDTEKLAKAQTANQVLYGTGTDVATSSNLTYDGNTLSVIGGSPELLVNTSTNTLSTPVFVNGVIGTNNNVYASTSNPLIGQYNSTNGSGFYHLFQSNGTTKGFLGYGPTLFSAEGSDYFGIRPSGSGLVLTDNTGAGRFWISGSGSSVKFGLNNLPSSIFNTSNINIEGSQTNSYDTKNSDFSAASFRYYYLNDDGTNVNGINAVLPDATTCNGRIYEFKVIEWTTTTSVNRLSTAGGTINGAATYDFVNVGDYVKVQSDGTNWSVVSASLEDSNGYETSSAATYITKNSKGLYVANCVTNSQTLTIDCNKLRAGQSIKVVVFTDADHGNAGANSVTINATKIGSTPEFVEVSGGALTTTATYNMNISGSSITLFFDGTNLVRG